MSEEQPKYVALFLVGEKTSNSPGEMGGLQQNRSFKFFNNLQEAMTFCEQVCAGNRYAVSAVSIMGKDVNIRITGIDDEKRYVWAGMGLPPKEAEGG